MQNIIKGSELSVYLTTGLSIGVSKKENADGLKSKFVVFTAVDEEGGFSQPIRHIMFEADLFPGAIDILSNYRMMKDGQPLVDSKGGYPVDLLALKASEHAPMFQPLFRIPGGMVMQYKLKKGECYANTIDGEIVRTKVGDAVTRSEIPVFVQVKFFAVDENGKLTPNFANKMGLEERGQRLESQFYRTPVQKVVQQPTEPVAEPDASAVQQTTSDPF